MRNLRKASIFGMTLLIATMVSCSKDDANEQTLNSEEKATGIFGVYTGTLKTEGTERISDATFMVARVDSQTVEIHCYGEEIDTTFMMHMYENGDTIMLCNADSMFMMEYGDHMSDGNHGMGDGMGDGMSDGMGDGMGDGMSDGMGDGMNGDGGMMDCMNHMDEEHDSTDMQYGGFDMNNSMVDYTFKIKDGDNEILKRFQGTKR